tara:strand:+ start:85289 stop:85741 length:453 start_codon:yes stop_codon:yes gene_type:complete
MKKIVFLLSVAFFSISLSAQIIAKVELKEPIEGLCNYQKVYAILPMMEKQKEAVPPVSKEKILQKLNEVKFLKENPKHKGKGTIKLFINCKGEVVEYEITGKTKSKELDDQFVEVFKSLGIWTPAVFYDKKVDSIILLSFRIKKGKVSWE